MSKISSTTVTVMTAINKYKKLISTRDDFYHKIVANGQTLKEILDTILFPNGAPRGTYYNYFSNRR